MSLKSRNMDNFYPYDAGLPALGAEKREEELLTAEIDEDEYDALNDETFGDVGEGDDWEESHERLAELDMKIILHDDDENDINGEDAQQSIVEKSISQLGLDDLDDPAIMTCGRPSFGDSPRKLGSSSPSASTVCHLEDLENNLRNNRVENNKSRTTNNVFYFDQQSTNAIHQPKISPQTWSYSRPVSNDPPKEIKQWPSVPTTSNMRTVADVEKDIFLKPRAQTLDDVEREMHNCRKIPNSPASCIRPVQPPIGTPPQLSTMITPMSLQALSRSPVTKVPFMGPRSSVLAPPQIGGMFHPRFPQMVCQPPRINPFSLHFNPSRFLGKNLAAMNLPVNHHNFGSDNSPSDVGMPPGLPRVPLPIQYFQQQHHQNMVNWVLKQQNAENLRYSTNGGKDSYDGLMTFHEKDWVIKIQMRQLQSDNPYLDDYYYTTFMSKKKAKEKVRNGLNGTGEPKVLLPERIKIESRTYVPTQFEGSLGKLQVASVNNPRKILDVGICRLGEEEDAKTTSTHRFCYILLIIEKLYTILLEIEDEEKHILALPETAQLPHQKARQELLDKLFFGLIKGTGSCPEENFVHIISVRKGRNLLMRSLLYFEMSNQVALLTMLFRSLNIVLRKDQHDLILLHRCDVVLNIIEKLDMGSVTVLAEAILEREKSNHSSIFHTKFGAIVVCSLLKRAECHYSENADIETDLEKRWATVIMHIVDILCALPENVAIKMSTSAEDICKHFKRFSIEKDQIESVIEKFQQ